MFSTSKPSSSIINYLLLLGAGLIWGSQYILNKAALESFPTSMIAAGRIGIGVVTLTLCVFGDSKKSPALRQEYSFWHYFPDFLLIGLLEATIPCVLVAWAQLRLASSVTAILIGTVPLFTTLLEFFFVKETTLPLKKILGVILGFCGIVILMAPELAVQIETHAPKSNSILLPAAAALTSAFCFSLAMILIQVRLGSSNLGPIRSAQGILLGSLVTIVPLMLWSTKPWSMTSFHPTSKAIIALVLLGIFCGGIVYTLFVLLIKRAGPSFASMTNYLVPPIGAFLGITFSGEKMTSSLGSSLIVILMALWLSSSRERL